jgi:hypothetical protein
MKKRAISIDPSRAVSGEKDVERVVDEAQLSPLPAAMGPGGVLHMEPGSTPPNQAPSWRTCGADAESVVRMNA